MFVAMGWRYIQGPEGRHVCIIKLERIQCVPTASLKDKATRFPRPLKDF